MDKQHNSHGLAHDPKNLHRRNVHESKNGPARSPALLAPSLARAVEEGALSFRQALQLAIAQKSHQIPQKPASRCPRILQALLFLLALLFPPWLRLRRRSH